jgi:hypothetical protein
LGSGEVESRVRVIVITGSMGAGKTTVLGEASDLLSEARVPHVAVDLDAIGTGLLSGDAARRVVDEGLAAIYAHAIDAGVSHVLVAEALETPDALGRLRRAMPGASIVVCRLTAPIDTMQARIRAREPGMHQARFVDRVVELERVLEDAHLEDFVVANGDCAVTEAARELLQGAGWLPL